MKITCENYQKGKTYKNGINPCKNCGSSPMQHLWRAANLTTQAMLTTKRGRKELIKRYKESI